MGCVTQIDRYVFLILKALSTDSSTFLLIFEPVGHENQHHLHLANFYLQYLEANLPFLEFASKHQKLIKYDLLPCIIRLRQPRFIENWILIIG
jgi:hypothetical protein